MSWESLKESIQSRMASALGKRVTLHCATASSSGESAGSIAVDGTSVFRTTEHEYSLRHYQTAFALTRCGEVSLAVRSNVFLVAAEVQLELARRGLYSELGFHRALDTYLSGSVPQLIRSTSVMHRALARLDRRVKRNDLAALRPRPDEHSLVKVFHELRADAEGVGTSGYDAAFSALVEPKKRLPPNLRRQGRRSPVIRALAVVPQPPIH